jgi:hypothetical protein
MVQRWMSAASPNTLRTARSSALAPSITPAGPGGVQAPIDQVGQQVGDHRLVLGVAQPQPDRQLVPSAVIANATTQQCSATQVPSTTSAATCSPLRSRPSSSSSALAV